MGDRFDLADGMFPAGRSPFFFSMTTVDVPKKFLERPRRNNDFSIEFYYLDFPFTDDFFNSASRNVERFAGLSLRERIYR
jgi:hypothetical protein